MGNSQRSGTVRILYLQIHRYPTGFTLLRELIYQSGVHSRVYVFACLRVRPHASSPLLAVFNHHHLQYHHFNSLTYLKKTTPHN